MATTLPTGTVTFLFTDIEGSAQVAREHPETWESLQKRHNAILRDAVGTYGGHVFHIIGDAFCSAFHTVGDGVQAALQAQRDIEAESWGGTSIRVRMGIHTGEAQEDGGDYRGYLTLTHVQRLMSIAHGGQILLSNASAGLVRDALPAGVSLLSLGEHHLKSVLRPQQIWQVAAPGLRHDFPPLESPGTPPHNLPLQLTSFVGRETEMTEISELLQSHRLVTLTGAGGTGKTRLSLQVAARILDRFKDGGWLVELAPLTDPTLVASTVASVLGLREEHSRLSMPAVLDWLKTRDLLLILDNCEHLVDACASLVDAVLHAVPEVRILCTSREALGIAGEVAYRVPSLESPGPALASYMPTEQLVQYTAIRLFRDRAKESLPSFELTDANAPAVAQICHRLDGIPLAIELAAVRLNVLSVTEIAERLNDRFRLLTGGGRTALPRHQTLHALIDWSHSLLSEPERMLLRRLSAFAGGWTLAAAEQVCAEDGLESSQVLDVLTRLIDKSLVGADRAAGGSRYRMLETIREYAQQKLSESGERPTVRGRHLEFMLGLAEAAAAHGHGLDERAWHDRLENEVDNLRAALDWAMGLEDAQIVLRLAAPLYWFWWTRGYWKEGYAWLQGALEKAGAERPTEARARALTGMAWFRYMADEPDAARAVAAESVAIGRILGDRRRLAESLTVLGLVGSWSDPAAAGAMLNEGLALSHDLGYKEGIAAALLGLGNCKVSEESDEAARTYYEDSARLLREVGDRNQLAFAVRRLGMIALRQGDYPKAFSLCAESLSVNSETQDKRGMAASLAAVGSIAARQGRGDIAARLYGGTAAVLESLGARLIPLDEIENEPYVCLARAAIGAQAYERAFSEGHDMKMEQVIRYALEQAAQLPG